MKNCWLKRHEERIKSKKREEQQKNFFWNVQKKKPKKLWVPGN